MADCLEVLAILVHLQHQDDRAQTLFEEGLALAHAGNNTATVADILFYLGWMARTYLSASINHMAAHPSRVLASLTEVYTPAEATAAQQAGAQMTLDEAISFALAA